MTSRPDLGVNCRVSAQHGSSRGCWNSAEEVKGRGPSGNRFVPNWTTVQVGRIQGGMARNVVGRPLPRSSGKCARCAPRMATHIQVRPQRLRRRGTQADDEAHVAGSRYRQPRVREVEGLQVVPRLGGTRSGVQLTGADDAEVGGVRHR